ncbi:hypothetical protein FWG76_00110, partial [Candidatus Saccharibacteria bacterium]|nr:hypothetical protein [Candidatus Saccharibacteria bacterium]
DETSALLGTKHITLTIAEATKPPVEPPTEPEAPPTSDRIRSSDTVRNIGFIAGITALLAAITFVALKLKRIRRF